MTTRPETRLPPSERRSLDRQHREDALDEALADSFPASDPPAMVLPNARRFGDEASDRS
jgi:hypothetical protein